MDFIKVQEELHNKRHELFKDRHLNDRFWQQIADIWGSASEQ